jgi:hypothetical protein
MEFMPYSQQQIFIHPIDMGAPYGMASDGTAWCSGALTVIGEINVGMYSKMTPRDGES